MIKIKILRHSERLDFTRPLYWLLCFGQYWADSPLTNNGHSIAYNKGINLKKNEFNPSFIYTSPYCRTMATATEIQKSFTKSEIIIEPLLAEYQPHYRHNVGLYPSGITTNYNGTMTEFKYPEKYSDFDKRIKFIINRIIEKNNNDVLIVTHGEVLKVFINHLFTLFPKSISDVNGIPYLTTLSFDYDKINNRVVEDSILIEY